MKTKKTTRQRTIPARMLDGGTLPSANDIEGYLKLLPDKKLLTADEEKELGRRCDEESFHRLVMHNTRLVVSEALKFVAKHRIEATIMDLVSEGMFGLFEAARRFDPGKGCKFSTYAVYWIRCFLFRTANQNRIVRVPRYMHDILAKIPWAWCKLTATLDREPTSEEMAELMRCTVSEYKRTVRITSATKVVSVVSEDKDTGAEKVSLDHVEDYREGSAFDKLIQGVDSNKVWRVLEKMQQEGGQQQKEAQILMARYGFGLKSKYTLQEIGDRMGLSRERVRQLETTGLEHFRALWVETE